MGLNRRKNIISPDYEGHPRVKSFIESLPAFFDEKGEVLYNDRNVIKAYMLDESDPVLNPVVVKRYKQPVFIQRFVYSFIRKSKAERAYYNAIVLRQRGFDTPREVAYIEDCEGGLFKYGYFISASDMAPPIEDSLPDEGAYDASMVKDFAAFAAELHRKGILHHDLNCNNVLFHPRQEGGYRFSLIDNNRMKILPLGKEPSREACFDNLTRFTRRMELFEHVIRCYAQVRGWEVEEAIAEAKAIKERHDTHRKRKKAFLRALFPQRRK